VDRLGVAPQQRAGPLAKVDDARDQQHRPVCAAFQLASPAVQRAAGAALMQDFRVGYGVGV
jgi:hypothetical protein